MCFYVMSLEILGGLDLGLWDLRVLWDTWGVAVVTLVSIGAALDLIDHSSSSSLGVLERRTLHFALPFLSTPHHNTDCSPRNERRTNEYLMMAEDGSKSSSSHSREHRERRHGEQHRSSRHSHHREHHRDSESSRTERERRHEGDRHGHEHRHGHGHRSSRRQERERSRSEDSEERRERKERKRKRREERGERGAYKRRAHDDEDGADETKRNERVVVVDDDEGGAVPVPMPPGPAIPGVGDADVGVEVSG